MNFSVNKYESPQSFTHDTNSLSHTATQYTPIPFAFHQTLEDVIQSPSSYLCQTDTPSDIDNLWASMPPITEKPKTYQKIWGYSINNKEVFTWITIDGRWLCEEPDDDEEYLRITFKELPYSNHVDNMA